MTQITISLKDQEKMALRVLADKEFRDPRQQAALIIRKELQRRGLLILQSELSHIETSPIPAKGKNSIAA